MSYLFFLSIYGFTIYATWKAATNAAAKRFNAKFQKEAVRIRIERAMFQRQADKSDEEYSRAAYRVRLLEDELNRAREVAEKGELALK